jgi:hypothetical protein
MQILLPHGLMVSNIPMGGSHPRSYVLEFHTPYSLFHTTKYDYHTT